jgi:hypothetical protein
MAKVEEDRKTLLKMFNRIKGAKLREAKAAELIGEGMTIRAACKFMRKNYGIAPGAAVMKKLWDAHQAKFAPQPETEDETSVPFEQAGGRRFSAHPDVVEALSRMRKTLKQQGVQLGDLLKQVQELRRETRDLVAVYRGTSTTTGPLLPLPAEDASDAG